jgi:hypothetical protein
MRSSRSSTSSLRPSVTLPIKWGSVIRGLVALFLAVQAAGLSLSLARWSQPIRYASLAALLVALGLIIYGLSELWRWIRTLTLRRVLVIVLVSYLLAVTLVWLTTPGSAGLAQSWLKAMAQVPLALSRGIVNGGLSLAQFPDQFRTAYTGQSSLIPFPNAKDSQERVAANAPSAPVDVTPPKGAAAKKVSSGQMVTVTSQAGSLCQMDALSDGPFTPGTVAQVVEGPRFLKGEAWWRVRTEMNSGWCPGKVLVESR